MNVLKLKPCPFCGSDDLFIKEYEDYYFGVVFAVVCDSCGGRGAKKLDAKMAAEEWNERAESEDMEI